MTDLEDISRRDDLCVWVRWYLRRAPVWHPPQSLSDLASAAIGASMTTTEYLDAYAPHMPADLAREVAAAADVYRRRYEQML